jgi:hypothetical protein
MCVTLTKLMPHGPAWLLLVHQLPPRPTHVRVKIWRRLQDLGAVALKNSVYVLPHSTQSREDFEWVRTEIRALGGEATVFAAESVDTFSTDDVAAAFRRAREADYAALASDAKAATARPAPARTMGPARRAIVKRGQALQARLSTPSRSSRPRTGMPPRRRSRTLCREARPKRLDRLARISSRPRPSAVACG